MYFRKMSSYFPIPSPVCQPFPRGHFCKQCGVYITLQALFFRSNSQTTHTHIPGTTFVSQPNFIIYYYGINTLLINSYLLL